MACQAGDSSLLDALGGTVGSGESPSPISSLAAAFTSLISHWLGLFWPWESAMGASTTIP